MRPAREVAHAFCGGHCQWPGKQYHTAQCDRLTAAIEADRRELMEACAKAALTGTCKIVCDHTSHGGQRHAAGFVRALIPKEDSRG